MKNFLSFKICNKKNILTENPEKYLLFEIVKTLGDKNIRCDKIKQGSFCFFTRCVFHEKKMVISFLLFTKNDIENRTSFIWCQNCIPYWKRFFGFVSNSALDEGDELEAFCKIIDGILKTDSHYKELLWLTRNEWVTICSKIKGYD